jgi:hypothetical protein
MNERIKELAEQAVKETQSLMIMEYKNFESKLYEKFAELIVQECADLCDRFQARDVGMQPAECAGAIRKMFGVER